MEPSVQGSLPVPGHRLQTGACHAVTEPAPLRPVSGLLPWQVCFLAFILGVLGYRAMLPAAVALAALMVTDTTLRGWPRRISLLAFVLCFLFGFGYAAQRAPDPVTVPAWVEARQPVELRAVVDRIEPRPGHRLRLVLRDVVYERDGRSAQLQGNIVWTWRRPDRTVMPGQEVTGLMRVVPVRSFGNPGAWDYAWYWQRQGVMWRGWPASRHSPMHWGPFPDDLLSALKARLRTAVAGAVPDTSGGGLVRALVTGDRSALDREATRAMREAGLAHTMALSGLHVGFVAGLGMGLAWLAGLLYPPLMLRIPRLKLGVLLAAPLVAAYAWLGQPSSSLLRAAVMFAFWGVLLLQGRGRVLLDGLFFALAVIVFWAPLSMFDISLQMSALAVAGIGLLYPRVRPLFAWSGSWWRRCLGWAGGVLAISLCANLALLPLVSRTFGTFSPNILFNLLWIPVLAMVVMPLGLVGMALAVIPWTQPAGAALLTGASMVTDWLMAVLLVADGASLTPALSVLRPLWPEMLGGGLLLVVGVLAWANRRVCVGLAGMGFLLMVTPHLSVMAADSVNEVRLSVLDTGQSQAAVVSLPGGRRWLVDGAGGSLRFDMGEAVVAPYLTLGRPPRLEGVFMSHPDVDHSRGLPFILSRFSGGGFYIESRLPGGDTGQRMRRALGRSELEPVRLLAGDRLQLDRETFIEVLHPADGFTASKANERSLVLRLVRRGTGLALLPGDIEQKGIAALLESGRSLSAEVLVLPHHGSRGSLSEPLYRAVDPEVGVCASGFLNGYGFPHPEVVDELTVPVFTTAEHGLVTAIWDRDNRLSVRVMQR